MARKRWTVPGPRRPHVVDLEHGFFSGRRRIRVDGRVVVDERRMNDTGSEHEVAIGNRKGIVVVRWQGLRFRHDLVVDGVSMETGHTAPAMARGPMPGWGWVFVGACGLIPIVTLGGCFPAAIGGGGASICWSIGHDPTLDDGRKLAYCLGATAATWLAFFGFVAIVAAIAAGRAVP